MKLYGKIFNTRRVVGNIVGSLIFGILAIVVGLFIANNQVKGDNFVETEATIFDIQVEYGGVDETDDYTVIIKYTVGGQEYTTNYPQYSSNMKVGDTITIKYDPNDPLTLANETKLYLVFIVVGVVLLIYCIVYTAINVLRSKNMKEQEAGFKDYQKKVEMYGEDLENPKYDEDRTYYFGVNPSERKMFLQTTDGELLFNVKCDKVKMIGASEFKFEDIANGKSYSYMITQSINITNESLSSRSYFKINGMNCWDFIHKEGFRVHQSAFEGGFNIAYEVERYGMPYAKIKTVNPSVMGIQNVEGLEMTKVSSFTAPGFYEIVTREQDLHYIALLCYTFSSSSQIGID